MSWVLEKIEAFLLQAAYLPFPKALCNKIIALHLLPLKKIILLHIYSNQIKLCLGNKLNENLNAEKKIKPDATITGYPTQFLKFALMPEKHISNTLQLEGDLNTLMALNRWIGQNNIDWEEILSHFIGDIPAHLSYKTLKHTKHGLKKNFQNFKQNAFEYCVNEIRLTPDPIELEQYCDAVDVLRDHSERLLKRWEHLHPMIQNN